MICVSAAKAQVVVQNTTYTSGQNATVIGPATIQAGSAVLVSSGANVTYQAETSILLEPGFQAQTGSTFHTSIVGSLQSLANTGETGNTWSTVSLTWSAPSNPAGIAGYNIYRNNVLVGTTTSTGFTDTGLTSGITYTYTVASYNSSGVVSGYIGSASGTPSTGGPLPLVALRPAQ
jgi:hypothetical protein